MDALKRYGFWILCGAIALGCAAFYLLGPFAMKSDNATQSQELSDLLDLKPASWERAWAARPTEVPGDQVVEANRQYAASLGEELKRSQELLRPPQRWKGLWTPEEIAEWATKPTEFRGAYAVETKKLTELSPSKRSGYANLEFLLSPGSPASSFDFARTEDLRDDDQIALEARQLMLQVELVRILNEAKALRLPDEGIRFVSDLSAKSDGAGAGSGRATAASAAPSKDPLRKIHPFLLKADLDLASLPALIQGLAGSTFNLHLKSLKIEKLADAKLRDELIDPPVQLVKPERRNEIVRVELGIEALELLPEKKA